MQLEEARQTDAESAAAARRAGRADPKRSATAAAEKRLADLQHEARITVELVKDAGGDLEAAV